MVLSTLLLTTIQAFVRHLGQQEIHGFQITFFASTTGLVFLLLISLVNRRNPFVSKRKGLLLVRGLLLAFSNLIFFYGLTLTPLVEATALSFVGVVFAVLAAVLILGESMYFHRWVSTVVTFVGIVAILRPGYIEASLGAYAVLLSSLTWGLSLVVAKLLSRTESTVGIQAWSLLTTALISSVFAYPVWQSLSMIQIGQALAIGIIGTLGHLAMTKSLQLYDAAVVVPINCTRLVWAAVIGLLVFSEFPDRWTIIGSVLIACSIIYLSRAEVRKVV